MNAKLTAIILLLCALSIARAAPPHPCEADAREQAKKLLDLHIGDAKNPFYPVELEPGVQQLKPIRHPVYPKLKLDVLQIYASDAKGMFRM
jgi:hypothetical protein